MNDVFDESFAPFNIIIYANGVVYCVEADLHALSHVLMYSEFMYNSKIDNVIDRIMSGSVKEEGKSVKHNKSNKSEKNSLLNLKCTRCGISCRDFILQNKKGCPICWIEFREEIDEFLYNVYESLDNFINNGNVQDLLSLRSHEDHSCLDELSQKNNNSIVQDIIDDNSAVVSVVSPSNNSFGSVYSAIKDKEIEFREKFKELDDSIKNNYNRFISCDNDFLQSEIKKSKERLLNLINNGKYDAANVLREKIDKLEKKINKKNE